MSATIDLPTSLSHSPAIPTGLKLGEPSFLDRAEDHTDLETCVLNEKLKVLLKLITHGQGEVFGPVRCWMYSIEWQKRGLPHAHILVWLMEKLRPNQIDLCISAELPDRTKDPPLFNTVSSQMLHGPCGVLNRKSPCMKDGRCSKRYPREFTEETLTADDGYPLYRR